IHIAPSDIFTQHLKHVSNFDTLKLYEVQSVEYKVDSNNKSNPQFILSSKVFGELVSNVKVATSTPFVLIMSLPAEQEISHGINCCCEPRCVFSMDYDQYAQGV